MTSFFSFLTKKKFPRADNRDIILSGPFTVSKAIIYILFFAILIVSYLILISINNQFLVTIPARGGTLTEGVIGSPRFINPILAATETDTALTHLVYAGLMKENTDNTIVPELAQSYEVSPDGRMYTFTLRKKIFFHDDTPVTSSDVAFTIEKLQDENLNPRTFRFWQTVHVETPDQSTVAISLLYPDTSFLEKMTVGILPAARWQGVVDEAFVDPSLNLNPVGAGPFKFEDITYDESGAPETLTFIRNKNYPLTTPYLSSLIVSVFANQNELMSALKDGSVDVSFLNDSNTAAQKTDGITATMVPTDTVVEIIRRSNEPLLQNSSFLVALNRYIDKKRIVDTVENGYGIPASEDANSVEETLVALNNLGYLYKNGTLYKGTTPVTLSIAIENQPELIAAGNIIVEELQAIGIPTSIEVYDQGTFKDGLDRGIFPLALVEQNETIPPVYQNGIPLYTKSIIITTREPAKGITYQKLSSTTMRYSDVTNWFTNTDRVWKFLANSKFR